jgi:hypothetical protein
MDYAQPIPTHNYNSAITRNKNVINNRLDSSEKMLWESTETRTIRKHIL